MNKIYCVWCVVNPPNEPTFHAVQNPEEGALLIHALAFVHAHMLPVVESNAFGLEYKVTDSKTYSEHEWSEWYNDDGEDIHDAFEVAMYVAD